MKITKNIVIKFSTKIALLVFVLLIICGMIYSTPFVKAEAAYSQNWKKLYKEFLETNRDRIYNCECGYINDDDVPELIYNLIDDYQEGFAPTAPVYITTVSDQGKLISFSALPERTYGHLYFYEKSGLAYCGGYQHGYLWTRVYRFDKNWDSKLIKSFSSYENESEFEIDDKKCSEKEYNEEFNRIFDSYDNSYGNARYLPEKNLIDYYIYLYTNLDEINVDKPKVTLKSINDGTGVEIIINKTKGAANYYVNLIKTENEYSDYLPYKGEYTRLLTHIGKFESDKYAYTISGLPKGKYTFEIVAYSDSISVYNEDGYYDYEYYNVSNTTKSIKIKSSSSKTDNYKNYDFSKAKAGDVIRFGSYEQDGIMTNGKEDIEWIVLSNKKGKLLLLSKYMLDCIPYNNKYGDFTWETCSLRKWLNKQFYKNAFTDEEKAKIVKVKLSNPDNPDYGTEGGKATKDRIFMLSTDDIINSKFGFNGSFRAEDTKRQCSYTTYAGIQGVNTSEWILRSPGSYQLSVVYVDALGIVNLDGEIVDLLGYDGEDSVPGFAFRPGIRPALYISVK